MGELESGLGRFDREREGPEVGRGVGFCPRARRSCASVRGAIEMIWIGSLDQEFLLVNVMVVVVVVAFRGRHIRAV